MNVLERSLIEKAGNENGFENVLVSLDACVRLGSARHRTEAVISQQEKRWLVVFECLSTHSLPGELARDFTLFAEGSNQFIASSIDELALLLGRAAKLSQALPTQAVDNFETDVQAELAKYSTDNISQTDVERQVRQRIGQNVFRNAMLAYWGGACSVTGITIPEVLRASHAKPWADCTNDSERLDVFNGFLLTANLDALFDRFLISFSDAGNILISDKLSLNDRKLLGLHPDLILRWLTDGHLPYLKYHRAIFLS